MLQQILAHHGVADIAGAWFLPDPCPVDIKRLRERRRVDPMAPRPSAADPKPQNHRRPRRLDALFVDPVVFYGEKFAPIDEPRHRVVGVPKHSVDMPLVGKTAVGAEVAAVSGGIKIVRLVNGRAVPDIALIVVGMNDAADVVARGDVVALAVVDEFEDVDFRRPVRDAVRERVAAEPESGPDALRGGHLHARLVISVFVSFFRADHAGLEIGQRVRGGVRAANLAGDERERAIAEDMVVVLAESLPLVIEMVHHSSMVNEARPPF
jgi:hypothetical protein